MDKKELKQLQQALSKTTQQRSVVENEYAQSYRSELLPYAVKARTLVIEHNQIKEQWSEFVSTCANLPWSRMQLSNSRSQNLSRKALQKLASVQSRLGSTPNDLHMIDEKLKRLSFKKHDRIGLELAKETIIHDVNGFETMLPELRKDLQHLAELMQDCQIWFSEHGNENPINRPMDGWLT